jgi:hypothetical protein
MISVKRVRLAKVAMIAIQSDRNTSAKEETVRKAFYTAGRLLLAQLPHCFGQLGEDRYRKSFILFKGLL